MSRLISREYLESQQYPSRKPSSLLDHDFDDEIPEKPRFDEEMLGELLPDGDISPQLFAERSDVPVPVRVAVIATRDMLGDRWYEWLARVSERAGTRSNPKWPTPPVAECATVAGVLRQLANGTAIERSDISALLKAIDAELERIKYIRGTAVQKNALTVAYCALSCTTGEQQHDAVYVESLADNAALCARSTRVHDEYDRQLADAVELAQ